MRAELRNWLGGELLDLPGSVIWRSRFDVPSNRIVRSGHLSFSLFQVTDGLPPDVSTKAGVRQTDPA